MQSVFAAGTTRCGAGGTAAGHRVCGAVARAGNSGESGEKLFYILRLTIGTLNPVFGTAKNKLFKFGFAS